MNYKSSIFTQTDGLAIQSFHVSQWKALLRPALHKFLDDKIAYENSRLTQHHDGYDVFRGDSIHEYIINELSKLAPTIK